MAHVTLLLTLEVDLPDDVVADATVGLDTVMDIGNGWLGTVGKVVRIQFLPSSHPAEIHAPRAERATLVPRCPPER